MNHPNWKTGQLLLPEHFKVSEGMAISSATKPTQLQGLGGYGFADFKWDDSLLEMGVLKFKSLKLVNLQGHYFALNENLTVITCPLAEVIDTSGVLWLNISEGEPKEIDVNGQNIEVVCFTGAPSPEESDHGNFPSLPLGSFSLSPSGAWCVKPYKHTPLLSFKNNYFWSFYKSQIESILLCVDQRIKDDQLNGVSPVKHMMAQSLMLKRFQLENEMITIDQGGAGVPREIFQSLYHFYANYSLYLGESPQKDLIYKHDKGCVCFENLIHVLNVMSKYEVKEKSLLPFVKGSRYFQLENIPKQILASTRVYLLVQYAKEDVIDLMHNKVASVVRLPLIHQNALPGINIEKEISGRFSHLFDSATIVYKIQPGLEWDHAVKDKSLGLSYYKGMGESKFYLYSPDYAE
tara:strand:- start:2033 stop:3250 length:1218 start_codon:yes stop_codon:yes gene_type:complete